MMPSLLGAHVVRNNTYYLRRGWNREARNVVEWTAILALFLYKKFVI